MSNKLKAAKSCLSSHHSRFMRIFFTGMAFGLLMYSGGYPWYWAALCSIFIYAGSMQFVAVNFFAGGFSLLQIALMTLAVNIRHMFYGISFLDRFSKMGKKKPYMIFR